MKTLFVVLVLIVVLFVVFALWGASKHSNESEPDLDTLDPHQHSTLDAFNGVFVRFAPKFEVNQLQPSIATFDLRVQAEYNIKVLGDEKHKFRQAKFLVQPSKQCAHVEYTASGDLPPKVKNPQKSEDSHDTKHPNEFTFTIFEREGSLTIARGALYAGICKVTLE